jgi:hypothetical protein
MCQNGFKSARQISKLGLSIIQHNKNEYQKTGELMLHVLEMAKIPKRDQFQNSNRD